MCRTRFEMTMMMMMRVAFTTHTQREKESQRICRTREYGLYRFLLLLLLTPQCSCCLRLCFIYFFYCSTTTTTTENEYVSYFDSSCPQLGGPLHALTQRNLICSIHTCRTPWTHWNFEIPKSPLRRLCATYFFLHILLVYSRSDSYSLSISLSRSLYYHCFSSSFSIS